MTHPEDQAERSAGWNRVWRERYAETVSKMPAKVQGEVHELMKRAWHAGVRWEAWKHEPQRLGGVD